MNDAGMLRFGFWFWDFSWKIKSVEKEFVKNQDIQIKLQGDKTI